MNSPIMLGFMILLFNMVKFIKDFLNITETTDKTNRKQIIKNMCKHALMFFHFCIGGIDIWFNSILFLN